MKINLLLLAVFVAACDSGDNGTGSTAGTGGSTAGTGGSTAGTGGSTAGTGGSTAGTGGSTAGTGGTTGGTTGALANCPGTGFNSDGVLDVDLKAVHVTGHVTLKSAPLPNTTNTRGSLIFVLVKSGAVVSVSLGSTGDFSYDTELSPGTYDVRYAPDGGLCGGITPLMPCVGGTLQKNVALTANGVLNVDIPLVQITGQVTLKGAPMPSQPNPRGALGFTAADGSFATTRSFGASGAVTYNMPLLPGSYSVSYATSGSNCNSAAPPALPCNGGTLKSNLNLQSDGVLDVDIPAVQVTGQVTLKGAPMPSASGNRGALNFTDAAGGSTLSNYFGASGAVSYAITLLPGTYNVGYAALGDLCSGVTPSELPCNSGTLKSNVSLTSDGVLDLDVPAAKVTGSITLQGGKLPAASGDRGALNFMQKDGGNAFTNNLGTSGAGSYSITLLPGSYDVDYAANSDLCVGASPSAFPCIGGTVKSAVTLQSDGVLDVDLPAVQVSGTVTLKGGAMPAAIDNRGALRFTTSGGKGSVSTQTFGPSGAVSYAMTLLPGSYTVGYVANDNLCQGLSPSAFPCNGGPLKSNVSLTNNGVLDVDIPAVAITGTVTLNSTVLPAATGERGALQFLSPGGDVIETPNFAPSGAVSYAITLLPGNYVLSYVANSQLCASGAAALPCDNQIIAGCP